FQVYLALPLQASMLTPRSGKALVAALFVVSGLVAVVGQLRITRWFTKRWGPGRSLAIGVAILAVSFVPLTVIPDGHRFGTPVAVGALLVSAALLAVGSAAVFPFEMDTVVSLAGGRLVATHYGFYNTIVGAGILIGNLATGSIFGAAQRLSAGALVWGGLVLIGIIAAVALYRLEPAHDLQPAHPELGDVQPAVPAITRRRFTPPHGKASVSPSPGHPFGRRPAMTTTLTPTGRRRMPSARNQERDYSRSIASM
ncbi:MFS transporter, partial [Mycobacterium sp. WUMAC-067]